MPAIAFYTSTGIICVLSIHHLFDGLIWWKKISYSIQCTHFYRSIKHLIHQHQIANDKKRTNNKLSNSNSNNSRRQTATHTHTNDFYENARIQSLHMIHSLWIFIIKFSVSSIIRMFASTEQKKRNTRDRSYSFFSFSAFRASHMDELKWTGQ